MQNCIVLYCVRHAQKLDMKIKKLQRRELSLSEMDEDDTSYIMEDK
jgi:hypothetical protein